MIKGLYEKKKIFPFFAKANSLVGAFFSQKLLSLLQGLLISKRTDWSSSCTYSYSQMNLHF